MKITLIKSYYKIEGLKEDLKKAGKTQEELARFVGMDRHHMNHIILGKHLVTSDRLEKIKKFFKNISRYRNCYFKQLNNSTV